MAIIKQIEIDGRMVPFKASAAIPRIYRAKYRRDIFADLERLVDELGVADGGEVDGVRLSGMDPHSLETFENIAYIMAKYADPTVPDTAEEWLDGFNTFSIYMVLPRLIELWGLNMATEVQAKKNLDQLTAR